MLKGNLTIQRRDSGTHRAAGNLDVVPKGFQHCPMAAEEAHPLLIAHPGTPNTGNPAAAPGTTI